LDHFFWMFDSQRKKIFTLIITLPLRQWEHRECLETSGKSLGGTGKRIVAGRAGKDKSPRECGPIQLRLDRFKYLRRLLVFVNEHHLRPCNSAGDVGTH
jgi:hypothetical protein